MAPEASRITAKTLNRVVFLLDVDNTLLDNDQVTAELRSFLTRELGADCQERYWEIFESVRAELGYADYLGALQRYRVENLHDPEILCVSSFLVNYAFAARFYPGALDVVEHLGRGDRRLCLPTATWCFSNARSRARGCSTPSMVAC